MEFYWWYRYPCRGKEVAGAILLCTTILFFGACSKKDKGSNQFGPPQVLVAQVTQQDVPIVREWIGSLDGSTNADIRARVSGYLISKEYKEGRVVQKGDLLFEIDPSVYEAAVEQSKAAVAQAEANQLQADQTEQREVSLFEQKVESRQNRDNAVQANQAAKAEVKAQQATLKQAELNLKFTKVVAPITGVAGIANPGIGDLVGPTDAQPLATISTLDPIKVYFQISEQDYLKIAPLIEKSRDKPELAPPVQIVLADGSLYPPSGTFLAMDRQVDDQTGTIRVAVLFPNPDRLLRPGQFVRVRVMAKMQVGALLVPQRAVSELQTSFEVAVVGSDDKAQLRSVKVGERFGSLWVIEEGLKPGEQVVVEGKQRLQDGQLVKSAPWLPTPSGKEK